MIVDPTRKLVIIARAVNFDYNSFREGESEVVLLFLEGKGKQQIEHQLGISDPTVEFHLSNIYKRVYNISNRLVFMGYSRMECRVVSCMTITPPAQD